MESENRERNKKAEYDAWVEEQKRILAAAKLRASVASAMPNSGGLSSFPTGKGNDALLLNLSFPSLELLARATTNGAGTRAYNIEEGFNIYWDFVLDLPLSVKNLQVQLVNLSVSARVVSTALTAKFM